MQSERYAMGFPILSRLAVSTRDSWATYLYLGKAKLKLRDNAEAERYLQSASEMNRDETGVFYLLPSRVTARLEARPDTNLLCSAGGFACETSARAAPWEAGGKERRPCAQIRRKPTSTFRSRADKMVRVQKTLPLDTPGAH